jgi:predicted P-loop ATPase/GTPase
MKSAVLVSGLLTYDSGKTWFSIGLAKSISKRGYSVGVFKPIAGHNLWSQFRSFLYSTEKGILVGEDVAKYSSTLGLTELHIMNPIDVLLSPLNPVSYITTGNIGEYLADLEDQFKQMVLARYSNCLTGTTKHYIFRENVSRAPPQIQRLLERFALRVSAEEVELQEFIKLLRSEEVESNLEECRRRICTHSDVVIIESFNDAIAPYLRLLSNISTVAVVMPTAIAIYTDIRRLKEVVIENISRFGEAGLKASRVVANLPPERVLYLKPRSSEIEADEAFDEVTNVLHL